MESNRPPLGVPMPAEYRYYGGIQPQPVGAMAIAAMLMVGLVAVVDVVESIAGVQGQVVLEGLLSLLKVIALLCAGVVFVVWLWRARTNVEATAGVQTQRLGKGWAIGCWICPIVSFWYPYQYLADVWRASAPDRQRGTGLLVAWWLIFWVSHVVSLFSSYRGVVSQPAVVVANLLEIASGVLLVLAVKRISDWQTAAMRAA